MLDPRLSRMAQVLVDYSLKIAKGDRFLIRAKTPAAPLAREVYRLALIRGAYVDVSIAQDGLEKIFLDEAQEHQLAKPTPMEVLMCEGYNKVLTAWGESNTRELTAVPPNQIKKQLLGRKKIRRKFFDRISSGAIKWCGTEFPTSASAQEAGMAIEEYEDFVFKACACDKTDPVAFWKRVSTQQDKIIQKMNRVSELHIVARDTNLKAIVRGRKWQNCDGRENFPDGEVFTSPVENSLNGYIRFSFPGIYQGKEIENIFLEFENGKVTKATATKGEDLLHALLKVDAGASRVGEIAIGTNYGIDRFTKNMLFDEKIGGTIHLALGDGFAEAGSKNKSTLHWDMLCDMREGGKIFADGHLIYRNGKLTDF